ncbi:pentapeptide repeat-containing protein [uncultured Nocardioides sp.]|uniref:pentapeptide repeat-containing protein n=1 Tax=uncultured Nocardioides sp. TaxID=198441 RepID=UPI00260D6A12|nr:pentapeptide repeat-containing protein [uncultured Nocardioides sp.]
MKAPRRTPPSLVGLTDTEPGDVDVDDGLDGVRVTGLDLSDRVLHGVTLQESELVNARADGTRLERCRMLDVRLDGLDAPELVLAEGVWRDSEVLGSRLGALSAHGSTVSSLRLEHCKVAYLNLRGSTVSDLVLTDCVVGELDLADATLERATFERCTVETLTVRGARLKDVDLRGARLGEVSPPSGLRGATLGTAQLLDLAPAMAAESGILLG